VGYVFSVGNQTRLAVEELIEILCEDERVTAFGLYLEGIKDAARFAAAAERARRAGKPIALIKSGRTAAAARTAHTHTGAMTGADAVFDSFCRQAGVARCDTLATLCETLKIFHTRGPLKGNRVLIMGASGGDMAMTADVSRDLALEFAPFPAERSAALGRLLSERVSVANPLDIHTYLWFDPPALRRVFGEVFASGYDAAGFMLDCPPEGEADTSSFDAVINEYIAAAKDTSTAVALIGSLPETMGPAVRQRCLAGGVAPLQGLREALEAMALAAAVSHRQAGSVQLQLPAAGRQALAAQSLSEHAGKRALEAAGVSIPRGHLVKASEAAAAAGQLRFPVVLKVSAADIEHKTEAGGVALNLRSAAEVEVAAARLSRLSEMLLVEEMVTDTIAEVLVGVVLDAQFGQVLVLGSGGIFTEVLSDTVNLLPPWNESAVRAAVLTLKASRLIAGYRGKPRGDLDALVQLVLGVARYASGQLERLLELDVNPVLVRPQGMGALAVDAVIRLRQNT
jgi:acetyl-CoA synthetase